MTHRPPRPTEQPVRPRRQRIRGSIWNFYASLRVYRLNPSRRQASALGARFDRIFRRRTGFATLDRLLARLHANKAELLMVLDRLEIPPTPTGPRTTSAVTSRGGRSAPGREAMTAAIAAMLSSVWQRHAVSSAFRSGIIWAAASRWRDMPLSKHSTIMSGGEPDTPDRRDCPGFCPSYVIYR